MKKRKKFIQIALLLALVVFSLLEGLVIFHKDHYIPEKSDAALVLGYSLKNGNYPSTILEKRLQTSLSLYQKGYFDYFIVSGGQGPQDRLPVAQAMKQWLIEHQVPQEAIFTESQSKNTYENMQYSQSIADIHNIKSVIVITSDFHIFRSMLIAKHFFEKISGDSSVSAINMETFFLYIKEPFSLLKYYIFLK